MKKALVLLAPGFEEIEAVTVIDILRRARIEVTVAGVTDRNVTGSHDITMVTDKILCDLSGNFDAVILPGGMPGATNLAASPLVRSVVKTMHQEKKLIAAICAAPAIVLSPLGVLKAKTATCFSGMQDHFEKDTHFSSEPVVIDGNVMTSRGPATALLFAIAIVEQLVGKDSSEQIRKATMLTEKSGTKG